MSNQQPLSNPKFIVRYTLGLFLVSNWLYNTLVVGEDGIADFSQISSDVFNDQMFYSGAYKQVVDLVADINEQKLVDEMMDSKTILFNKPKLREMLKLNENKMKELAEQGESVYDMLLTKKLAENVIFDEDIIPTSYDCIDGDDKTAVQLTIPLSLVFSVDSIVLDKITALFDMNDINIVKDVLADLRLDSKMSCFKLVFRYLELLDAK